MLYCFQHVLGYRIFCYILRVSHKMEEITMSHTDLIANQTPRSYEELLEIWRHCLTMDNVTDPQDTVIAELAEYFHMPPDQVRHYCLHWEEISVEEWRAGDRSNPDGLLNFYQTQTSWIFDTMWYHANQYHGTAHAQTVNVAQGLSHLKPG